MNISDRELILGESARMAATTLGFPDAAFHSVEDIREWVKAMRPAVSEPLETYLNDYWQWFDFHRRVEAAGKSGRLDADETAQLAHLVEKRNASRQALLAAMSRRH